MLNYLLFIKISPISLYPVYPSISYLFSLSLCLCLLCSILSAIHNLRLFKYLCQYSLFHHRRASSSFKHNTSFVARLPTIRRHKSQTIQTPGPDGSTLAKPPSSSRASTRYTRTIRDINASVENLGKLASGQACKPCASFHSISFALMMLSFVEDCLSSCYEVPIPFHRYYTYNFCLHTTKVITNTDTLLKHTHTHTHPHPPTRDNTTSKKWRGVKNKKKTKTIIPSYRFLFVFGPMHAYAIPSQKTICTELIIVYQSKLILSHNA